MKPRDSIPITLSIRSSFQRATNASMTCAEELRVGEDGGDVLEDDPLLREVGDVADPGADGIHGDGNLTTGAARPAPAARQGRKRSGFRGRVPSRTSKWRCGPVVRPVCPTLAIGSPRATRSPSSTSSRELWA